MDTKEYKPITTIEIIRRRSDNYNCACNPESLKIAIHDGSQDADPQCRLSDMNDLAELQDTS
jgi:hypothetical protein